MNQASLFDTDTDTDTETESETETASAASAPRPGRARAARSDRVLVVEADGGSRGNPGPAGYGALVREGDTLLAERADFLGVCSNNVAEYSGLIAGLRAAAAIDPAAQVEVRMDSRLVVEQMSGNWKIKHADMRRLALEAREVLPAAQVHYTWIPRAQNGAADALANAAMDGRRTIERDYDDAASSGSGIGAASGGSSGTGAAPGVSSDIDVADLAAEVEDENPIPDVDTNAPSLEDPDAITLVLVSPGVVPTDQGGDPELTDAGIELAGAAAAVVDTIGENLWPHLARPSMLLVSPLVRAQQTAALISEVADLGVPTVDDDFAPAQPSESRPEVATRVERALARLDASCSGCTVVIAAHADVIAAIVGTVVAAPMEAWDVFRIAPGTISVVRRWSGRGEVHVIGAPATLGSD